METSFGDILDAMHSDNVNCLEFIPIPMLITDADLNEPGPHILKTNKEFQELTGYSEKELIGKNPRLLQGPLTNRNNIVNLKSSLQEHGRFEFDTVNYRKDGSTYNVLVVIKAIKDEHGDIIGYLGLQKDITQQKEAEHNLIDKQKELEMILDESPHCIIYKDTHNNIIKVNKKICDHLGLPADKIEGKNSSEFWPDLAAKYYQDDRDVVSTGQPKLNIIEEYDSPETGPVWVRTNKIPIKDDDDKVIGVLVFFIDITEAKTATENLQKAMKNISSKNKELENFAYMASHDLQEPLRMISGYLQLIEKRYNDKLDKEGKEFIAYAVDGATRLKRLISGLLQYSRAGRMVNKEDDIRPCRVIRKSIKDLSEKIKEKEAEINIDFSSKCSKTNVVADEDWLRQVFYNIISNSLKFCDKKPQIDICCMRDNGMVIFSIKDNGIGIPERYKKQIFTMFKRIHSKDKYPGDGIGLALCKRIIESHKGKIWFESEEGKGTTFYIGLPYE